jgi:hypothetical protein
MLLISTNKEGKSIRVVRGQLEGKREMNEKELLNMFK